MLNILLPKDCVQCQVSEVREVEKNSIRLIKQKNMSEKEQILAISGQYVTRKYRIIKTKITSVVSKILKD